MSLKKLVSYFMFFAAGVCLTELFRGKYEIHHQKMKNDDVFANQEILHSSQINQKSNILLGKYLHDVLGNFETVKDCDDFFRNITEKELFKDTDYLQKKNQYNQILEKQIKSGLEGHTGRRIYFRQQMVYYILARLPFVKTICEIGFNAGHSALLWLVANPNAKVFSFDIGVHPYTHIMGSYLMKEYPERFNLKIGSSTKTVPQFSKSQNISCDILVVDGGHSYDVALTDILNMKEMANQKTNILLFDDCPNLRDLVRAWSDAAKKIELTDFMTCQFLKAPGQKGFVIGSYRF